jgi:hypothetical protein
MFHALLISFLFFDSLALPLPNQTNAVSTSIHSLLLPARTHIIDQLQSGPPGNIFT